MSARPTRAVACTPVAASTGGFDDSFDEWIGHTPPPRDDRLWRHPSELGVGASGNVAAARFRWLERQPSRASAWTAGIVGAILATGLVALGTHLATAFTSSPFDSEASAPAVTPPTNQLVASEGPHNPAISGLGPDISMRLRTVGEAMATVDIGHGTLSSRSLAMVIRPDGVLLMPSAALSGQTSLLVTLASGIQYVGTLVGSDAKSGIAIVHINGASNLPSVALSSSSMANGEMALAVTSTGGRTYSLGTVSSSANSPQVGSTSLIDTVITDLSPAAAPLGSALLDPRGHVVGIVTAATPTGAAATPLWLAVPVANEVMSTGRVVHGWLGMTLGRTMASDSSPGGVVVESINRTSDARSAGLVVGDVITSLNGKSVHSLADLRGELYVLSPGTNVRLGIMRQNKHIGLSFALDEQEPK